MGRYDHAAFTKDHYDYSEAVLVNNRRIIPHFLSNNYIFFYKFMLHIFGLFNFK